MTALRDMSAEQILAEIEARSDALRELEDRAALAKANFDRYEASSYLAMRTAHGGSVDDAKARLKETPAWTDTYMELQEAVNMAAAMKRDYHRACLAFEAWRTEQSTLRAMR
jgi:hypothetical protein